MSSPFGEQLSERAGKEFVRCVEFASRNRNRPDHACMYALEAQAWGIVLQVVQTARLADAVERVADKLPAPPQIYLGSPDG